MRSGRGQTAFEYLLLAGMSMTVVLVTVIARSFLTGPAGGAKGRLSNK